MSRTGRRPVVLLTSVSLVISGLAVLCTARLQHARATVRGNWAAAVSWGVAASLVLLVAFGCCALWATRRRRESMSWAGTDRRDPVQRAERWLGYSTFAVFMAGMCYTAPAVTPRGLPAETVTTAVQLGAIAFMVPMYAGLAVVLIVSGFLSPGTIRKNAGLSWLGAPAADGELLTAVVSPGRRGRWSVTWVRRGAAPRPFTAPTLTSAVEQADAAAAQWFQHRPATANARLELAIQPGPNGMGPVWEVAGSQGALTAYDLDGTSVDGAAFEDLLAAVRSATRGGYDFALHWIRPAADVTQPASRSSS
jgi:hypothetical protein